MIVVVLLVAGVSARSCSGGGSDKLTQEDAVAAAEAVAVVKGSKVLVRYLNQGIPPRGTWIVSFYTGPARHPITAQTVLIDAATGEIVDDGR
jgi:Peptidase propeptide and YPEB domain